MALGSVWRTD